MKLQKKIVILAIASFLIGGFAQADTIEKKSNVNELLNADFETDQYKKVLKRPWGKATKPVKRGDGGSCLRFHKRVVLSTDKIPYDPKDTIKVSLDLKLTDMVPGKVKGKKRNYLVCWMRVVWFENINDKKPFAFRDLLVTRKRSDWKHIERKIPIMSARAKFFALRITNAAEKGTFWIDNLNISSTNDKTAKPRKNLLGDPSFEYKGRLGADLWFTPKSGCDWDGLSLFSKGAVTKVTTAEKVTGKSSLHLRGNATVISNRFSNNGEKIFFSGWIKTKGITSGKKRWCRAGIQLVFYDKKANVIGHRDIKLIKGDNKWKRFKSSIILSKRISSVEVWARIFEGATGDAWFDDFFLYQETPNDSQQPYNTKSAIVNINADAIASELINPVWGNVNALYPGWIMHPVGEKAVPMAAKAGISSLRVVDPMESGKILKKINSEGKPVYDWTFLDKTFDFLVKNNITPLVTIERTPKQISSAPREKSSTKYPPRDYDLWGEIVEDMLIHLVERYGKDNVTQWYFDIWNEPESFHYFKGTTDEFYKVYEQGLTALLRVEKKFGIKLNKGTMSSVNMAGSLNVLANRLNKKRFLKHIDFISGHIYAGTRTGFINFAHKIKETKKIRDSYKDLKGKPIIISEYNGSSMPQPYRNGHVIASLIVKASRVFLDLGIKRAYFHSLEEYPHKHHKNKYFANRASIINKAGIPKANYNAFVLLDKLNGGHRVSLNSSNEPVDGIAVKGKDGSLRILLTSFDDVDLNSVDKSKITVNINWKEMPKKLKATIIRLDKDHGDAYTEFIALGKPEINDPNCKEHIKRMLKAAELKEEKFSKFSIVKGKLKFNVKLNRNSIIYLEFK